MTVTARTLITKAMQKVGILVKGEVPAADETSDALDALNFILSSWSNDSTLIVSRVVESFTLTGGTASYLIGSGQTFSTVRPISIVDAYIRQSAGVDLPMDVISDEQYANIAYKAALGIPYWLNYTNAYPYGTINLYPVPSASYSLFIVSEKPITTLTLDAALSMPAGWERAIIYNLAVDLCPDYGQQPSQDLLQLASSSRKLIQMSINKVRDMDAVPVIAGTRNIYTGWNQ